MAFRGTITQNESQRRLSLECKGLRDIVDKLRQDLLLCKNETQKVTDQLQCLVYLVKRAWSGDHIACIHVSNIVGIPPPEFKNKEERVNVSPRSDPIANWTKLCIGVLNKMYYEEELDLRASQLMYLQDREGYLDDELACHGDVVRHQSNKALLNTNTFHLLQAKAEEEKREQQEQLEQLNKQKQDLHLQYRKKYPHRNHLVRKPTRESVQQEKEISAENSLFVVKPLPLSPKTSEKTDEQCDVCKIERRLSTPPNVIPKPKQRAKSAEKHKKTSSRPRPRSAYPSMITASSSSRQSNIDLIEKDLKQTTKTLQDRLCISKQGMI